MTFLTESIVSIGIFQSLLSITILIAVTRLTVVYFTTIRYPSNLPRVYEKPKATSFKWSTRLTYYTDCRAMFLEAYENYSKRGKTVLIPGLGFRNEVMIPNTSLRWMTSLTPDVASVYEAFAEVDQACASLSHDKFILDPWQGNLVKTDLTAILETIVVGLNHELQYAFDDRFGKDTSTWKEIEVLDTMKILVAQASSRFTVGLPLCRNETYLKESLKYNDQFIINAGLVAAFPLIIRPFIKPLAYLPQRHRISVIKKIITPLYNERIALLSSPKGPDEPKDHFQLILRYAQTHRPTELNLNDITSRLVMANFGSHHQTAFAITNILFNIISSDAEHNTISELRKEFAPILAANGGEWTKSSISQMWKADSICKETMRLQSFGGRAVMRKVVAKEGVVTEDGITIPKGSMMSIFSWTAQNDSDVFTNPTEFDPFRFSRMREKEGTTPQTFVTTGPHSLPFGHGKHACPGRFLVDFELKMILAYVVMNYDLKFPESYGGKRPESKWLAEAIFPPEKGRILVKRREVVSS